MQSQGWHILNDIIWYKSNASPNLSCRVFTASHETILWARKSKSARHFFNYQEMKDDSGANRASSVWASPRINLTFSRFRRKRDTRSNLRHLCDAVTALALLERAGSGLRGQDFWDTM